MSTRLAMFPLGTVLVPHAILPLHVFEPRYRVLMFDCLRGNREFGVVLIERGSEVGGDDQRFGVATVARIVAATERDDGRWLLLAVGARRVDVVEWLADDPYPIALVDEREEPPWPADPGDALATAKVAVGRIIELAAQVGDEVAPPPLELSDDGAVAAWQLVALAPIGSLDKQHLLAVDDPVARLEMLTVLAEEEQLLLAYRLDRE